MSTDILEREQERHIRAFQRVWAFRKGISDRYYAPTLEPPQTQYDIDGIDPYTIKGREPEKPVRFHLGEWLRGKFASRLHG